MRDEGMGTGGTVIACLFAFLIGAVIGIITTFTHRQFAAVRPHRRDRSSSRRSSSASGSSSRADHRRRPRPWEWSPRSGCSRSRRPADRCVIADEVLGYIWVIVPTLIGAVVVAWPRARVRKRTE